MSEATCKSWTTLRTPAKEIGIYGWWRDVPKPDSKYDDGRYEYEQKLRETLPSEIRQTLLRVDELCQVKVNHGSRKKLRWC